MIGSMLAVDWNNVMIRAKTLFQEVRERREVPLYSELPMRLPLPGEENWRKWGKPVSNKGCISTPFSSHTEKAVPYSGGSGGRQGGVSMQGSCAL